MRPTRNPRIAGLKSIATQRMRQSIQNKSINMALILEIKYSNFLHETRKIPDKPGLERELSNYL